MTETHKSWLLKQDNKLKLSWEDMSFVELTIQQINKDLSPYTTLTMTLDMAHSINIKASLIAKMTEILIEMNRQPSSAIPQLMYTIDIPESIFNHILNEGDSIHENLAEVILTREAFKVWLRLNY